MTDTSPFHIDYVKDAISKNPVLADDIRLTKLFCKAAKVYGAESYINGFSGHVIDTLIIHYGSFLSLIEAAARWPEQVFIDPQGAHATPLFLSPAKRAGPLILLDPIQPDRNAAAALSQGRFDAFKQAAASFLEHPSKDYFVHSPLTREAVEQKHPEGFVWCYALSPLLGGSKDVAGTKLLKAHEYVLRYVREAGFTIVDEGFDFSGEQAFCFVVTAQDLLPPTVEVTGPPLSAQRDADRFREAHPGKVSVRDNRLFALEPRTSRTVEEAFKAALEDVYVRSRILGAKVI